MELVLFSSKVLAMKVADRNRLYAHLELLAYISYLETPSYPPKSIRLARESTIVLALSFERLNVVVSCQEQAGLYIPVVSYSGSSRHSADEQLSFCRCFLGSQAVQNDVLVQNNLEELQEAHCMYCTGRWCCNVFI